MSGLTPEEKLLYAIFGRDPATAAPGQPNPEAAERLRGQLAQVLDRLDPFERQVYDAAPAHFSGADGPDFEAIAAQLATDVPRVQQAWGSIMATLSQRPAGT